MNTLPQRPLTVAEAASYLGVSKDAVRAWIKAGRLNARRLSKRITRIPWQSVAEAQLALKALSRGAVAAAIAEKMG